MMCYIGDLMARNGEDICIYLKMTKTAQRGKVKWSGLPEFVVVVADV